MKRCNIILKLYFEASSLFTITLFYYHSIMYCVYAELNGKPLLFVLKLDEAEIVHAQKLERVSITLMNRALDPCIQPGSAKYFSVQSEREIWPIASFQVSKESHSVLEWVFGQTRIPDLIAAQERGQLLTVPEIGSFKVEWHLAADMKTIKCMYGLSHGATSTYCCIYCLQKRTKSVQVSTVANVVAALNKQKTTWEGGLFSFDHRAQPLAGALTLSRWKPILCIPLERVHICTLHALNRIVEKILHLHFIFIWTIRDKIIQAEAIEQMQKVLSATGAHGGNVLIFKDVELSGKTNNIPNKPSLSGANCNKIFCRSTLEGGSDKVYIDIVNATRNVLNGGEAKRNQLEMWSALDDLRQYFTSLTLSIEQIRSFKSKVDNWGKLYVRCFGEAHVTHYMVRVKHLPRCMFPKF